MGLTVRVLKILGPHQCQPSRIMCTMIVRPICDGQKTRFFVSCFRGKGREEISSEEFFVYAVVMEKKVCHCRIATFNFRPGYGSIVDDLNDIGKLMEVEIVECDDFGSYLRFASACELMGKNWTGISDCDGFYTGSQIGKVRQAMDMKKYLWLKKDRFSELPVYRQRVMESLEMYCDMIKIPRRLRSAFVIEHC